MSRYIDEEALIKEIERCSYETWSKGVNPTWWAQSVKVKDNIVKCIERQPTADVVEVRHGEWLPTDNRLCAIKCGVCGEVIDLDDGEEYLHWNYCPICGAKMDGKRSKNG